MSITKTLRRNKLRKSVRKKISGTSQRPRIAVFRSNKFIYAQIIDDESGKTLVSVSSKDEKSVDVKLPKLEQSKLVGTIIAEKAKSIGIESVVFDRGGYLYHGRVKSLADGAREGGLKF